jgi:hypothetical protein
MQVCCQRLATVNLRKGSRRRSKEGGPTVAGLLPGAGRLSWSRDSKPQGFPKRVPLCKGAPNSHSVGVTAEETSRILGLGTKRQPQTDECFVGSIVCYFIEFVVVCGAFSSSESIESGDTRECTHFKLWGGAGNNLQALTPVEFDLGYILSLPIKA